MPSGDEWGSEKANTHFSNFYTIYKCPLIIDRRIDVKGANVRPVNNHSPDTLKLAYGDTLRKFRLASGLSQMKVAAKADISLTYLGDVERGQRNVALINIVGIARALDIPLDQFFAEVEAQLARYSRSTK